MEVVAATVATRAAATAADKVARVWTKTLDGRSLKIGCKCCFKINTLEAQPDIVEVVASRFPHTTQCGFMWGGLSAGVLAGWASHLSLVSCLLSLAITSSNCPSLAGLPRRC
jgi:hypothetical protein